MKRLMHLSIMLQICSTFFAQEFSTKLYFETANGEKDTLEIGYDPTATHGVDVAFGEIEYSSPIGSNDFQVFFIDPSWWSYIDPPFGSYFYTKKQIINKNSFDVCNQIIAMLVPTAHLPITISWDKIQSGNIENEICFFTDRHFSEFSCGVYANELKGDAWNYAQKVDIRQNESIQISSINDIHQVTPDCMMYPDSCSAEIIAELNAISFSVLYFGFIDPIKTFDLLDPNNTWSVLRYDDRFYDPIHFPELPPVGIKAYLSTWYKVGEDSICEGKTYKKIMKSRDANQEEWEFDRLMRQEEDKIYLFESSNREYLLYDFGMNVGDTIISQKYSSDGDLDLSIATVLESVRDTIIGETSRKLYSVYRFPVWEPECKAPEIWIEGIGSLLGLYRQGFDYLCTVGPSDEYSLLCFSYNDELQYRDSIYNECYYNKIGPMSINSPNKTLNIRSNPVTNTFSISGLEQTAEVIIADLNGRVVLRRNIENNEDINIASFATGIYIYRLIQNNQFISSGKITKVN